MQVAPVHYSNTYTPVTPVPPVKAKSAEAAHEAPPKPKAATPPHVGKRLDIQA